jgi:hypothetical protein
LQETVNDNVPGLLSVTLSEGRHVMSARKSAKTQGRRTYVPFSQTDYYTSSWPTISIFCYTLQLLLLHHMYVRHDGIQSYFMVLVGKVEAVSTIQSMVERSKSRGGNGSRSKWFFRQGAK